MSSHDVNCTLAGDLPVACGKHWTKSEVKTFVKWMTKHGQSVAETTVLYRGTPDYTESDGVARTFTSTSKDPLIAKRFGKFLLVLHVQPGVKIFDMAPHCENAKTPDFFRKNCQLEKEILILPGHDFIFRKKYKNHVHIDVTKHKNYKNTKIM
jgi:ABC-type thiamine transport system substrate-binding protein